MARALMFQGTGSSVGKSVLVAGIARALTRRGLNVRPFKPQNMSNNAAVTQDGGEIGRAQALQACACGVSPTVDMNPVLLKPQSETGAQLVVRGQVRGNVKAREYQSVKRELMGDVLEAFSALAQEADIILVEGAGSASEINLRANDIANMGFAQAANIDVVLVGDIDRGGVIASLVGTHTVLDSADRSRIKGFVVNRMRGDPSLFSEGMTAIAAFTGWQGVGLVPHLDLLRDLPAEDATDIEVASREKGMIRIVVPHMPMIANFDDLDPLRSEPGVSLEIVPPGKPLPDCDLIILPGSKSTISDLAFLRGQGWDIDILAHTRKGGQVMGICGGYQMLGHEILDLEGIEGNPSRVAGLGLLNVETSMTRKKQLSEVSGELFPEGVAVKGYEIHSGRTRVLGRVEPFAKINSENDGAVSADGRVWGTYLHGVFDEGAARATLLKRIGYQIGTAIDHTDRVEAALDAWAAHLEQNLDIDALLEMAREV